MTIRVLLDAPTRMVTSALEASLSDCDDIEVVETDRSRWPARVDVVVLQQGVLAKISKSLQAIATASHIGVVALDERGAAGALYRIDREGWQSASVGPSGLAEAIRAVASPS